MDGIFCYYNSKRIYYDLFSIGWLYNKYNKYYKC